MAFLSSVAGYVVTAIISAIAGWLGKMVHSWYTNVEQDKQATQDARQSVAPLKAAPEGDADAIDKASSGALGGI